MMQILCKKKNKTSFKFRIIIIKNATKCLTSMHANTAVLQPNKHSVCAQPRSTGAGGKHPHTVYSHCNERMLLIMKKEDGSSLRRTHPHITRSVKKGLVVIVASPACALSLASLISLIKTKRIHAPNSTDILVLAHQH